LDRGRARPLRAEQHPDRLHWVVRREDWFSLGLGATASAKVGTVSRWPALAFPLPLSVRFPAIPPLFEAIRRLLRSQREARPSVHSVSGPGGNRAQTHHPFRHRRGRNRSRPFGFNDWPGGGPRLGRGRPWCRTASLLRSAAPATAGLLRAPAAGLVLSAASPLRPGTASTAPLLRAASGVSLLAVLKPD